MKKYLLVGFILLSGCAYYGPSGLFGGYTETALNEDTYKVSYRGNGYCTRDQAADYLLRRAAELTLNNGYKYFVILAANSDNDASYYNTPATVNVNTSSNVSGNLYGWNSGNNYYGNYYESGNSYSNATIYPSQTVQVNHYADTAIVKMFHKRRPGLLDANLIMQKYVRPMSQKSINKSFMQAVVNDLNKK